jgi:hypothetical protein
MKMIWYKRNGVFGLSFVWFLFLLPVYLSAQNEFKLLDSSSCALSITHDTVDHFFERVQPLEVSILLKQAEWKDSTQESAALALTERMQQYALTPDDTQRKILETSMKNAMDRSATFLKKYPLPQIQLGLIEGALYGPSVFYTRENGIYIPKDMVVSGNESTLTQILIHEIFHIQSRNYPTLQQKIYAEIGFIKLDRIPDMPAAFRSRILLNPDGTDWNFAIPLRLQDEEELAYPMIVSNQPQFDPAVPAFFAYLKFQLFPLYASDKRYELDYTDDFIGLGQDWYGPFFQKITNNTQYIIHPDELAADNFVLLTRRKAGEKLSLSPEGYKLLDRIEKHYK